MKKFRLLFAFLLAVPCLASCNKETGIRVHFVINNEPLNLETTTLADQVLKKVDFIDEPTVVVTGDNPDNYDIRYWCIDPELTTPWDFDEEVTQSMTLYAKWVKKHTVTYYQAANHQPATEIWTNEVWDGDILEKHEELQDTYEDLGYYSQYDGKKFHPIYKLDFSKEIRITEDMNIYLQRSEHLYLTPEAIERRFTPMHATGGTDVGSIETKKDENGESYSEITFGSAKTASDPYILIQNPPLDVTKSQTLEITMRNLGPAYALAFYWVGKWADGKWIDGKEATSFVEAHAYHFRNDGAADKLGQHYQINQTKDSPWITYRLPISSVINNGVSTWGAAYRITALRIQSTCRYMVDEDGNEIPNILQIKSIKGAQDEDDLKFAGEYDSDNIQTLCVADDEAEVEAIGEAQAQLENGFILPKNNNEIDVEEGYADIIHKKTGTLIHGTREDGQFAVTFTPSENREINLHPDGYLSTLEIQYLNYSYVPNIRVAINYNNSKGKATSKEKTVSLRDTKDTKTTAFSTVTVNFHEKRIDMEDLNYIKVTFDPTGVDNLLQFYSFNFLPRQASKVVGENFDDPNCAGFSATGGTIEYDSDEAMSLYTQSTDGGSITKTGISFDLLAYEYATLSYEVPEECNEEGITSVDVKFTFEDDTSKTLSFTIYDSNSTDFKDFNWTFNETSTTVTSLTFTFHGTGSLYLKSLVYSLPDTSINLANTEYSNKVSTARFTLFNYDSNELAQTNTRVGSVPACGTRFYFGADGKTSDGHEVTNFSLKGKHKLVLIYCNTSGNSGVTFQFGGTSTEADPDPAYKTAAREPGFNLYEGGPTGASISGSHSLKNNMSLGQWACEAINLPNTVTDDGTTHPECFIDMCVFNMQITTPGNIYVRGFSLI